MALPRLHSWQWLSDHCPISQVDRIKSLGYDGFMVMDFKYNHEHMMGSGYRKVIVFNRGDAVRMINYSKDTEEMLNE